MNTPWVRSAWLLLAIIGLIFAPVTLGFGRERGLLAVIVCLLLLLAWHLFHLRQLMGWLEGPLNNPLPRGRGFFRDVDHSGPAFGVDMCQHLFFHLQPLKKFLDCT